MPYIKQKRRVELARLPNDPTRDYPSNLAQNAGELNYLFSVLANDFIKRVGLNYENLNAVVGALEGAKAEFQRRVVAPYEDTKIQQNGDVYK